MASPLKPQQIDALIALLRVAADGELLTEQMRCRLGECHEFEPYEVFQSLQGGWQHQKGWLSGYGIQRWLTCQPHHLAAAHLEDVVAMLVPYEGQRGELRYDGFLNMVLPKDPSHTWQKDTILSRSMGVKECHTTPEVAYRLCQLFENEIDVSRHLKFHRKNLVELGTTLPNICKFLDSQQGFCAGMGGLLSPASVRHKLVDELQALSITQCNALLQRVNPSGSCLAPFNELAKVLSLGPPWPMSSSWRTDPWDTFEAKPADALGLSHMGSSFAMSPRLKDFSDFRSPSPTRVSFSDEVISPIKAPRQDSPRSHSLAAPASWGDFASPLKASKSHSSPAQRSTYSTVASTADFLSPRTLSPLSPLPQADSALYPRGRSSGYTSPLKDPGLPQRASSQPGASGLARAARLAAGSRLGGYSMDASRWNDSPRTSPRTNSSFRTSQRSTSPFRPSAFSPLKAERPASIATVLNAVVDQAKLDKQMEDAKALIPFDASLETIFERLDRFHKGYITDTDLWSFGQQFGGQTSFASLCTLVHEIQLRRPRDPSSVASRLSFRELGSFLLKAGTQEHEVMKIASTDDDARSVSYLLKNSEPCPGCGVRVQRDADAAGCPSVTCSMCGTPFRCFIVLSDVAHYVPPLSISAQYQLYRLLDTAACAAVELESARQQLATQPSGEILCKLSSVFTHIADGRLSLSLPSLRRVFVEHDVFVSEQELSMLRQRYVKKDATEVTFAEFVRQLTPHNSSHGLGL